MPLGSGGSCRSKATVAASARSGAGPPGARARPPGSLFSAAHLADDPATRTEAITGSAAAPAHAHGPAAPSSGAAPGSEAAPSVTGPASRSDVNVPAHAGAASRSDVAAARPRAAAGSDIAAPAVAAATVLNGHDGVLVKQIRQP